MKQILFILFLNVFATYSQHVVQKTFQTANADEIESIIMSNDSLLMIGSSNSNFAPNNKRVLIMKCDLNGEVSWSQFYGVSGKELYSTSVTETLNNYGLSGKIYDNSINNSLDAFFINTDLNGNLLAAISFGGSEGDIIYDIEKDTDSTYIAFGASNSFVVGSTISVYGLKISINGDTLWTKAYGGGNGDLANSICRTSDSMYVISGSTNSFGSPWEYSVFLMKINTNGDVLWHKSYSENNVDLWNSDVLETSDGGFLMCGYRDGQTLSDVLVLKTDSLGVLEWSKAIGDIGVETALSAVETSNGDYIITGESIPFIDSIGFGSIDALVLKLDNLGNLLWGKLYGTEYVDNVRTIVSDTSETYYIGGVTYGWNDTVSGYKSDAYFLKTDSNGVIGCNEMPVFFPIWEPTLNVNTNFVTVMPTSTVLNNLVIEVGGNIIDSIYCSGQVSLQGPEGIPKELLIIIDIIGRETEDKPNTTLIYIYSDGTIERVYRME